MKKTILIASVCCMALAATCNTKRQSSKEDKEIQQADTTANDPTEGQGEGTTGRQLNR